MAQTRLQYLHEKYGIEPCTTPSEGVAEADVVIIAVKPQNVQSLAQSIKIAPSGLILSIVAGLTLDDIEKQFKSNKLVRSMPNTPSMVLEGITVWTATNSTPPELLQIARELLGSFGEQIEVADESYLDMATAVSGTLLRYLAITSNYAVISWV